MSSSQKLYLLPLVAAPALVVGYAVYFAASIYRQKKKYKHIPHREPSGISGFFYGDVKDIMEAHKNDEILPVFIYKLMMKLNSKTIKLRFFNNTLVVTCDPRIIKEALIDQDCMKNPNSYKLIGFPGGERFLGNGLVTDYNKTRWKHRRAIFNPGFHKQALKTFMQEFNSKADLLIDHLKKISVNQTQPIKLLEKFNNITLDAIASIAFSMPLDSLNDPNVLFNQYITDSLDGLKYFFRDPFMRLKPWKWPFMHRYFTKLRFLRNVGRVQLQNRLEMIKNGEGLPNDILTIILKSHENEEFDMEELVDDFVTIFIAGQETTATTLASAFLEIGRNPNVYEKLKQEVDSVLSGKTEIEFEDLPKLKYCGAVFKEALRLYPPASGVTRKTEKEIKVGDLVIPAGTSLTCSIFASGRLKEFFPEPNKFNPERFLTNVDESSHNYVFFPFSLGPRNCIGQNFAQIEGKVIMAKFIQHLDFKLEPSQSFDLGEAGTLRPKDGTLGFISVRN